MFRLFNPCSPCCGGCSYRITAYIDWSTNGTYNDLDLYGKIISNPLSETVYYDKLSHSGLSLNHDANPGCASTPLSPEIITGTFNSNNIFQFWYNIHSNCLSNPFPGGFTVNRNIVIENIGTTPILINEGILTTQGSLSKILPNHSITYSNNVFTGAFPYYTGYNKGDESGLDNLRYYLNNIIVSCRQEGCAYYFIFNKKLNEDTDYLIYCKDMETDEVCWRDNPITTNCYLSDDGNHIVSKILDATHRFEFWYSSLTDAGQGSGYLPCVTFLNLGITSIFVNGYEILKESYDSLGCEFFGTTCIKYISGTDTKEDESGFLYEITCDDSCCVDESIDTLYLYCQETIYSDYSDVPVIVELHRVEGSNHWISDDITTYDFTCKLNPVTSTLQVYKTGLIGTVNNSRFTSCVDIGDCQYCDPAIPWSGTLFSPGLKAGYIISESNEAVTECNCHNLINKDLYLTINNSCGSGHDLTGTVVPLTVSMITTISDVPGTYIFGVDGPIWTGEISFDKIVTILGYTGTTTYTVKVILVSKKDGWYIALSIGWTGIDGVFTGYACGGDTNYSSASISYNCEPFEIESDIYIGYPDYFSPCASYVPCQYQLVNFTITE